MDAPVGEASRDAPAKENNVGGFALDNALCVFAFSLC